MKYKEKYEGYGGGKWRKNKAKNKKNYNNDFIYSLCLYFSLSESTILNTKTFVNC